MFLNTSKDVLKKTKKTGMITYQSKQNSISRFLQNRKELRKEQNFSFSYAKNFNKCFLLQFLYKVHLARHFLRWIERQL